MNIWSAVTRLTITDEPQEEYPFQETEKSLVYTMKIKKMEILNGLPAAGKNMQSVIGYENLKVSQPIKMQKLDWNLFCGSIQMPYIFSSKNYRSS